MAKVPPSSPACGSTVVVPLSLNVYKYPPRPALGRFWLLPSSPSSMTASGPQSLKAPAAAVVVVDAAAVPPPMEAADPGAAGGGPDLSGMMQPAAASTAA